MASTLISSEVSKDGRVRLGVIDRRGFMAATPLSVAGFRQVVTAPVAVGRQVPVFFNELQDRIQRSNARMIRAFIGNQIGRASWSCPQTCRNPISAGGHRPARYRLAISFGDLEQVHQVARSGRTLDLEVVLMWKTLGDAPYRGERDPVHCDCMPAR